MGRAREWRTKDKSEWGEGPWQDEPDKVSWVDEATGLDCLIVRNRGGALCGYVGVPESHPLFGVDYSAEVAALGGALAARMEQPIGEHPSFGLLLSAMCGDVKASPDSVFQVHGGLTFADGCHEPTREQYESIPQKIASRLDEAAKYPQGDAATMLGELREQQAMTFEEWAADQQGRRICHIPEEGRADKAWWFGFDCAHAGDYSPADAIFRRRYGSMFARDPDDVYRDRHYVEGEVTRLAAQLAEVRALIPEQQNEASKPENLSGTLETE